MKQYIIIIAICLVSITGWSQRSNSTYKPILNVGFQQGSHSMFQLGVEYDVLSSDEKWLFVGGGVLATPYHKEWHWLPYVDVTKSNGLLFYGVKASTKHVQPQVGISLLNLMDIGLGYGIPFNEDRIPVIKGFNLNIKIRLSGNDSVYPKLKMGF
ncbi:hypothetical protein HMPREF9713_02540 [Myroides odoratimimus CCUG 12700]|uniref:hypothetical protein n=1 Tax=Myroides odoratimimus TaxID=76832 RepID=UPI0003548404|nr:hypothetical protein [Myroides odoratimimus]EPH10191.1 hypothetical protein HMPREF9713_02540 [Myroides odoratimimus CCUG 12700]